MCIDYHKLNEVTKKNHFAICISDQMIERLASEKTIFCFLNGFLGFFKILSKKIKRIPRSFVTMVRMPLDVCLLVVMHLVLSKVWDEHLL